MIAERLALERRYEEAEHAQFWEDFAERFGEVGADPVSFYSFEIGHILHLAPDQMGELTPGDLMGAANMFDALYRRSG